MMPIRLTIFRRSRDDCRSAFSLIEMVVMMSIFTAASMTSLSILNHLVTISRKTTSHCLVVREVQRLAEKLRDDVHGCAVATVEADGAKLVLTFANEASSEFELSDQGVVYRAKPLTSVTAVASGTQAVNDLFMIEPNANWKFKLNETERMVSLLLRPASGARPMWQIDAAVANDVQ